MRIKTLFIIALLLTVIGLGLLLRPTSPLLGKIDHIIIEKSERRMDVFAADNHLLKTYAIALGHTPKGVKSREGDGKTPEGHYFITGKNANSHYYKSLRISYPNIKDQMAASAMHVSPGGYIMIHGIGKRLGWLGPFHHLIDWTNGCIAITNDEIAEIYMATSVGTPIIIKP